MLIHVDFATICRYASPMELRRIIFEAESALAVRCNDFSMTDEEKDLAKKDKISAIKAFRARTGAWLKDAQEIVSNFLAHG